MSTKKKSRQLHPESIAHTLDVLADVMTLPSVALMEKSVESYIKTGKFESIAPRLQPMIRALWDRTLYSGVADAEYDVDHVDNRKEPNISFSKYGLNQVDSFSNRVSSNPTIEFSEKPKIRSITRQTNTGEQETIFEATAQVQKPTPVTPEPQEETGIVRIQQSNRQTQRQRANKRQRIIQDIRDSLDSQVLSNFDPRLTTDDPYADLYTETTAEQAAINRLKQTDTLQVFATLNYRYPALGQESDFSDLYLKRRTQVVATSLEKTYQEAIKRKITEYVAKRPSNRSQEQVLSEIRDIYNSKEKQQYDGLISNLFNKRESLKITNQDYLEWLRSQVPIGQVPSSDINKRIKKLDAEIAALQERLVSVKQGSAIWKQLRQRIAEKAVELRPLEAQQLAQVDSSAGSKEKGLNNKRRHLRKVERLVDEDPTGKVYVDPRRKTKLSNSEKNQLIKLLGLTSENSAQEIKLINEKEEFSGIDLSRYLNRLKAKSGHVKEELFQIASRTANTEVAAAYNMGRLQVYLSRGVRYLQWISTIDARTSVFCKSLHLKIFSLSEVATAGMGIQRFPNTKKPEYHPDNSRLKSSSGLTMWIPGSCHPYCRSFFMPIYTDPAADNYPPELPPTSDLSVWFLDNIKNKKGEKISAELLEKIVQAQERQRQNKENRLLSNLENLHDIFNSGLSFLTRRLRQDQIADFTVDEVRRNDKQLVTALLGGAAVLGVGAMMYFFMKSNLGATLKQWLKTKTTSAVGTSVLAGLSEEAIRRMLRNLIRTSERARNLPPEVANYLPQGDEINDIVSTRPLGQELQANVEMGELYLEMLQGGIEDPSTLLSSGTTINSNLQKRALNAQVLRNMNAKSRQALDSATSVLQAAFSNKSGSILPSDITFIQDWDKVYRVGRTGKPPTFISKRIFDSVVSDPQAQQTIEQLKQEANRLERGLDGLEPLLDDNDELSKANLRNERLKVNNIKSIINFIENRGSNLTSETSRRMDQVRENLVEQTDVLNRVLSAESELGQLADDLVQDLENIMPSDAIFTGLDVSKVNDANELRQIQKITKESLREVRRDFLNKKQPYTLGTAARKRSPELSARYNELVLEIQNQSNLLNSAGITYNDNISDINDFFKDRINTRVSELINLDTQISERIKELNNV